MKLTCIVMQILLLATLVTIAYTSSAKQQKKLNSELKKSKVIDDQEAQSTNSGKSLRHKRGHHVVHIVKPVHKLKKVHVVVPKYHDEHHIEEAKVHHKEEVHHTFSESHEHVHEEENLEKAYDLPKVEEYDTPIIEPIEEHKEKIKVKHHHHHHHHNHVKTVVKKVPEPYPVEKVVHVPIEKVVHVPVEKIVHVPKPYPVEKVVEKIVHVPVEKIVHVPKPYPVEKIIEKPIHIEKKVPVEIKVPVEVKVPYPVEKIVHVPVEKIVEKVVHVPVEKLVHVPKPYPVIKPVPYPVEVKVPIHIPRPIPVPVEKKIPFPVKVEKKIPIPIFIKEHKLLHEEQNSDNYQQNVPTSYLSYDKDYSSSDSKIHPVKVHPNQPSPSPQSQHDQNSDVTNNNRLRNFVPVINPRNPTNFIKTQQHQHQQYAKDYNDIARNPPYNYQPPPQINPQINSISLNKNLHTAESNVVPVSAIPPKFDSNNEENKEPFQIQVPDQIPQPEALIQEQPQAQQQPFFQAYPIQLVHLQPLTNFQSSNGFTLS